MGNVEVDLKSKCGSLNEKGSIGSLGLPLLGGVAILEEMCHWCWGLRSKKLKTGLVSSCYLWIQM